MTPKTACEEVSKNRIKADRTTIVILRELANAVSITRFIAINRKDEARKE